MMQSNVFNVDNMEYMLSLPDNFFDLAIDDPPYGGSIMAKNKFQRHKTTDTTYRNKSIPKPEYYEQLYRVSKEQIIWGCQYQLAFMKPWGSFIVWDKKAQPDLHNMSSCDIAWYSKRKQIKTFDGHWCGAVKFEKEPTIHIHQKPVGLYKWILKNYAEPGMKIFDPHMGSGSSRIGATIMGYDYWGCELDKTNFDKQNIRYNNFISQKRLYD